MKCNEEMNMFWVSNFGHDIGDAPSDPLKFARNFTGAISNKTVCVDITSHPFNKKRVIKLQ
jgi:hypothetical protein